MALHNKVRFIQPVHRLCTFVTRVISVPLQQYSSVALTLVSVAE
jgi:hypothetical protein